MLKLSIIFVATVIGVYILRKNFRRAFYILWTGDLNPDWEKLGYNDFWPEKKGKGEK